MILLLSVAQAAGYYTSDPWVRSFGRAGASVASVDDLGAMYYNPAALTRMKGWHVKADVAMVDQYVMFDRADEDELQFDPIYNSAKPYVIPTFGAAWGGEKLAVALGFYPPYAPDYLYPDDGPQRYTLVDTLVVQTNAGPSAAYKPLPWLSLGAGLSWHMMIAEEELYLVSLDSDEPRDQIGFSLRVVDPFQLSWNAGLLIEPHEKVSIGLMINPPISFAAGGYLEGDLSKHWSYAEQGLILDPNPKDEDVTVLVTMPLQAKGGVAVRPIEGLEVEFATIFQKWDVVENITVTDMDLVIEQDPDHPLYQGETVITDDVVLPANYQNAWSFRLGGQYDLSDRYAVRAGGLYETSAIPENTRGVTVPDGNKIGYGLGASAQVAGGLTVDLGWYQSFIPEKEITNSDLTQVQLNLLDGSVSEGKTVGNGSFESRGYIAGVGLEYAWGDK